MAQDCTIDNPSLPITWQTRLPMLSSSLILRQLFLVLSVPSVCLLAFLLLLELIDGQLTLASAGKYMLVTLAILFGLFFLGIIAILTLYNNRYDLQFTVDDSGVRSTTVGKTKRKNALINTLLLFSGKPGPAGAGLIAASRQSELVRWENIDNFFAVPNKLEIQLRQGKRVLMLVHCIPETYPRVKEAIEKHSDAILAI
jgi:hypothetical protein